MMRFLSTDIPWETVRIIGFDLDGTLYDEFEFISQVYEPIARLFADNETGQKDIKAKMLLKWLEKGSSYPFIFSEILSEKNNGNITNEERIREALAIFRNFKPALQLSARMKCMLEECKRNYELFLVSDGSPLLQRNKINALGLTDYFDANNIFISGDVGKVAEKPSLTALDHLNVFKKEVIRQDVVFIGDRAKDRDFAKAAGFHFIDAGQLTVSV